MAAVLEGLERSVTSDAGPCRAPGHPGCRAGLPAPTLVVRPCGMVPGPRVQSDRMPTGLVRVAEAMGEATVPAEQPASGQAAWVPAPDGDQGGSSHPQVASGQGPRPPVGLIWRVRDRDTFRDLRRARRARCGPLTLAWLDDGRPPPPRVAFGISRHVGNAVTRNRLRRRLRELARRSSLPPGVWFVTATPGAAAASFPALAAWWDQGVASLRGPVVGAR